MTLPSGSFDTTRTKSLFWAAFPSVMLPMFMAVQDQTIIASALPAIAASLGDVERVSWIVVSYLLAATIAAPVYGYLGDVFGRRQLMFVALTVFLIASVLCSVAPSIPALTAARALQGLGGGGLMSLSQALIGEIVPPRQRGHFQGYLATVATTASVAGPVFGGLLTEHFGWRSIFWFNLPLCAIAYLLVLRLPSRPGARRAGFSFDAPGLLFFVGFILPTLLGLEQARRFDSGSVVFMAAMFMLGATSFVLLLRREKRAVSPLLPIELFRRPAAWKAAALAMCHGASLTSLVAFLPIYFRVVHGASASETGLMLLPISIFIGIGSIMTGRMVTRSGRTMIFPTTGLSGATLLFGLFALRLDQMTTTELLIVLSAAALCMGSVMAVVQISVQNAAGRKFVGAAAGAVQFSRTVGAAFGTALVASVLFATLVARDPEAAGLFAQIVNVGPTALDALDGARRVAVQGEIAAAFRGAFFCLAGFTALGVWLAATNPTRRV